ncbi:PREDICTED: uncharacterized protein LOC109580426 [Amphimedon queenslandica]|uniref:GPI-anchored protein n=1 Tax=Amphimedon queenslandica TaxID=400682 RepID=A0AAN0IXC1_AMPQE|nr:PREDICTED: uncharacterized protein LOC109580426 [Amphimedon queenslandica]XP_019849097.1 PREDICTED: uncharacterized protein LOC109580426 [Amphimedon queenslandica]XP_019849098.1 PREDICTED: uncharacterized protein LOC109580426 [Amphimedon queenslandica]XP_019849099.1 PREDICTED: uncharacterized protein LOC109580426 [Amphimedon queenslandica]|eukprot:XP_019849096.1 PREDICTED: uncharacterized protein LOC109580426 [Amphimedon queenslandica]
MSPSLFLVCLFLIAACTEGAVIDKERGMNDTALLQLLHHINKRQNIHVPVLERRQATCTKPDLPSSCSLPIDSFGPPALQIGVSESYLSSLKDQLSRICTSDCAGALGEYYRCLYSGDTGEYAGNLIEKYLCGQESGEYCPVRLIRSFNTTSNANAYGSIINDCTLTSNGLTCTDTDDCIDGLKNFTSVAGCCMEPVFGSGVRSCSGVSVPDACTGLSSTTESSATGIIATPIVAVSLMILALAGVFL